MLLMKSAHSSAVHSVMMVSGSLSALLRPPWPYVVGVCSADVVWPAEEISESIGDVSLSPTGEWSPCMLRSYSSSASDSG